MKRLLRISFNLITIALAIFAYQIYTVTRGFAGKFRFHGQEYFYWENKGDIQFGIPGKSWHSFNAQLVILLSALIPTYRTITAFIRWNRKRNPLHNHSETTPPLYEFPLTPLVDQFDDRKNPGNIISYATPSLPPKPSYIFPIVSIICASLQVAYLCDAFGKVFSLYLMFLIAGVVTTAISIANAHQSKPAKLLVSIGAVSNMLAAIYVAHLILND